MRTALLVIAALMFLAGGLGFAWGMWEEVALAPEEHAHLQPGDGMPLLDRWSVRAAAYVAGMQMEKRGTTARGLPGPESVPPDTGAQQDPLVDPPTPANAHPSHTEDPKQPRHGTVGDNNHEPKHDPKLRKTDPEPKVRDTGQPPPPVASQKLPPPVRVGRGLDAKSRQMLDKAHVTFTTAWKYYLKSRPEAPARERDAAARQAIRYFVAARKRYQAVLRRDISADMKTRIEARLVQLNRALFWTNKFSR